jgi:hypothetical protein
MKIQKLAIPTLILFVSSFPQVYSQEQKASTRRPWLEYWMEATVSIGKVDTVINNGQKKKVFIPIGTGVMFGIPGDEQKRVCLVTARHVFDDPSKKWHPDIIYIRFYWNQHLPIDKYQGVRIPIRTSGKKIWIEHDESSVDLAVIPLFVNVGKDSTSAVLLDKVLSPRDLFVGQPVIVLGFPGAVGTAFGSSFLTLPIARQGIISWLTFGNDLPQSILIDCLAFPGNSGGPVFNMPTFYDKYGSRMKEQQPSFIGIVTRAALQPTELGAKIVEKKIFQQSEKTFIPYSFNYMGLTQIESGVKVVELLEKFSKTLKANR